MQPPDAQDTRLPTTVALVGASVRAAAQSARRGGFAVLGADLFGDLDTLAVCDRHVLLDDDRNLDSLGKLLTISPSRPITPIIRVGGLANSHLDTHPHVLGPTPAAIGALAHPQTVSRLALDAGLRFPDSLLEHDSKPTRSRTSGRWLSKTILSSGGTGVTWHRPPTGADAALHASSVDPLVQRSAYLQRWIAGRNYGATFFAGPEQATLLGIYRSLFVRRAHRPFLYAGSLGPLVRTANSPVEEHLSKLSPALVRLGHRVTQQFNLRGLFNVDFMVDRNGDGWVLEINPRWTAASELVERDLIQRGIIGEHDSLLRWHVLAHVQPNPPSLGHKLVQSQAHDSNHTDALWIKQVVYANRPGRLWVADAQSICDAWSIEIADLPPPSRNHQRGEPLVSLIGKLSTNAGKERAGIANPGTESKAVHPSQWRRVIRAVLAQVRN